MRLKDFALYGSSPLFDNTVLVRCHICQFIVKLSAFIGHLAKRHKITNEQEIEESLVQINESERLKQEQLVSAVNKTQTNRANNKKGLKTKQLSVDNLYEKVFQKEIAQNNKINNKVELATNALPASSTSNSNEIEKSTNEDLKIKIVVEKIKNKINKTHSTTSLPTISVIKNAESTLVVKEPHNQTKPVKFTTNETTKLNQAPPVKQIANKGIKSYDPDKHCGVVIEQVDELSGVKHVSEPCTRSLTCKKHPISLRRQVGGRSKTFNELFKQYRDEKLVVPNQPQTTSMSTTTNAQTSLKTPSTPTQLKSKSQSTTPISIEKQASTNTSGRKYAKKASSSSQSDLFNNNKLLVNHQGSSLLGNVMNSYEQSKLACSQSTSKTNQTPMEGNPTNTCLSFNENMDNLKSLLSNNATHSPSMTHRHRLSKSPDEFNSSASKLNLNHSSSMLVKHHPRPSAVTSFNARLTDNGGGYTLWNRRQDNLRCVLTNAFNSSELFLKSNRNYTMPNNEFMQTQEHYLIEQNQNDDFNSTVSNSNQTSTHYSNGFGSFHATNTSNGTSNGQNQFFTGIDEFLSPELVNPFVNYSNAYNTHTNNRNEDTLGNSNIFLNDHGLHYTSDSFINNEFINTSSSSAPATTSTTTTTTTINSCSSSTNNVASANHLNPPMYNNHNSPMNNGHYHLNGIASPTNNNMNLKRSYSTSNQLTNSHVSLTSAFVDDEYGNSYKYMKLTPSTSPIKSNMSSPTNNNHNNHHVLNHHHNHHFNHAHSNQSNHLKKFSFSLISSSPSSSSSASSSISSLLATNNLATNIALSNNAATNGTNNQNNLLASKNVQIDI